MDLERLGLRTECTHSERILKRIRVNAAMVSVQQLCMTNMDVQTIWEKEKLSKKKSSHFS